MAQNKLKPAKQPSMTPLLKPYKRLVALLIFLTLFGNAISLYLPKLIANGINSYTRQTVAFSHLIFLFATASATIFVLAYLQTIVQTYASERVARDLRTDLSAKISRQAYLFIETVTPGKLLTNLTSDIDAVKSYVAQAISSLVSSIFIIIGASVLLLTIDWKLALAVLALLPIIGGTFFFVLGKVRKLFLKSREIIDRLNKVINESILGAALIRVLYSQKPEFEKFVGANTAAYGLGIQILLLFSALIPIITFVASMGGLIILALGGHFVINGSMNLGDFAAFSSYLAILIFPILVIGFMSNIIAQASASYGRIREVLDAPERQETGTIAETLKGAIAVNDVSKQYGEKPILKNVSLQILPHSKVAIIGPTAAGKTQLLYMLTSLINPDSGSISYDGHDIHEYKQEALHQQVGFVFQDSIIFNLTLRENIAFSDTVTDESLRKAIDTAELRDFIDSLPEGLSTVVSERGSSLSGGQKQRIMLARALALDPKVLLLDDFTARVDNNTESKILENLAKNYPDLTLVSVTQKISSIEQYDQIILLMEGEILARGTHSELMHLSPEYVQIFNSQKSTSNYEELRA